jgi:hypothetical protein
MRSAGGACICVVLGLFAHNAYAQPTGADNAEAHVRRGLELRRSGDDAAALAEFESAQALAPTPRVRAQIGLALQALGRWREAEEVELEVLSEHPDPWVRDHADLLRESLATAQHHLAWVSVDCNVAAAELRVNGAAPLRLPLTTPVRVVAGAVVLQVRADGYESVLRKIDVSEGARTRESVVLIASPPALPIGTPTTVLAPGPETAKRTAAWVTLATGSVLLAGGIAASVVSVVYSGMYNDDSRCFVSPLTRDQRCGTERGIAQTTRVTAIVTLAGGGLAVGAGAFLLATSRGPRAGFGARTVACTLELGSLGCAGTF